MPSLGEESEARLPVRLQPGRAWKSLELEGRLPAAGGLGRLQACKPSLCIAEIVRCSFGHRKAEGPETERRLRGPLDF